MLREMQKNQLLTLKVSVLKQFRPRVFCTHWFGHEQNNWTIYHLAQLTLSPLDQNKHEYSLRSHVPCWSVIKN